MVTHIHFANQLLNMAAERCKYATFVPCCSEKTAGSNVFKIGGNNAQRLCLLHETNFKIIYVRSYSFADIMTRDKYFAFKVG